MARRFAANTLSCPVSRSRDQIGIPCMTTEPSGPAPQRRRFGAPKNWREKFLACLAETSNVTASAECADISKRCVYKTKREDAAFAQAWLIALCEGYDHLEMDLLFRLRTGESRDTPSVKYDNATALRLLLAHRDTRARVMAMAQNVTAEEVRASLDEKLARLREKVIARREQDEREQDARDAEENALDARMDAGA
jgi:hypothetical protein